MTERKFNEAEVAAIFEMAAEAQHTVQGHVPSGQGMTVAELQAIGREVGLAPELIDQAARRITVSDVPPARTFIGLPIGVSRSVDLDRRLSDEEWERLVVDLRETFDAKGVVKREGSLRQWTNGNLQALLEPSASGHRVRLRTMKGDARGMMMGGLIMVAIGATAFVASLVGEGVVDPGKLSSLGFMAAGGAGMFGFGALQLPRWARTRAQQMEQIIGRLADSSKAQLPDISGDK